MCRVKHNFSYAKFQFIDYRHDLFLRVPVLSFVPHAEIKHSHGGTRGEIDPLKTNGRLL